jgi:hypothetical protein
MTNHLQTTKEAYLQMMNNLLEERRDITKMYYEVKAKVDEIDKLLMAGDSGKVSNGQAAEIMKYAELFNNRKDIEEKAVKSGETLKDKHNKFTEEIKKRAEERTAPRQKLSIEHTLSQGAINAAEGFKNMAQQLNERFAKDLPKPRQATAAELIASSVEPVKEEKPKEDKRKGRRYGKVGASGRTISVHGKEGMEEMIKILMKHPRGLHIRDFLKEFNESLGLEIEYKYFASALSKAKKNDSRIQQAGRGFYIYQR